jgi:hypothetical protein
VLQPRIRLIFLAGLASSLAAGANAQPASATLTGRVTDRSTGRGVVGARLVVLADSRSVTTDSLGNYEFRSIPAGVSQLTVIAEPFPALSFIVQLAPAERFNRPVELDSSAAGRSAQALPPVGVSAPAPIANYRLAGFERRRISGRGQYLTEDEIVKTGAFNVADAVKGLRGVTYECGGGSGCYVRMARAPGRCLPEYVVDDQVQNDFGPTTPIRDLVAIEVYNGPTDVPAEYAGRNAGCGVIVLWTRSGPTRKKP